MTATTSSKLENLTKTLILPLITSKASKQEVEQAKLQVSKLIECSVEDIDQYINSLTSPTKKKMTQEELVASLVSKGCLQIFVLGLWVVIDEEKLVVSVINPGSKKGLEIIANGFIVIRREIIQHSDQQPQRIYELEIKTPSGVYSTEISNEDFSSNIGLSKVLNSSAGSSLQFQNPDILRNIIKQMSAPLIINSYSKGGWIRDGYYSRSLKITSKEIVINEEILINAGENFAARNSDFAFNSYDDSLIVTKMFLADFSELQSEFVTNMLISFTTLAPIFKKLKLPNKPLLQLLSPTGRGKTLLATNMQSFFGDFSEDDPKTRLSFNSTPKSLAVQFSMFKDSIAVGDDLKHSTMSPSALKELAGLVQNYHDNSARSTLSQNREMNESPLIETFLMFTGEDLPPIEASIISRITIIKLDDIPPKPLVVEKLSKYISRLKVILPPYIQWFLSVEIETYLSYQKDFKNHIANSISRGQNIPRISYLTSLYALGFKLFGSYLVEKNIWEQTKFDEQLKRFEIELINHAIQTSQMAQEELGARKLLTTISVLIASKEVYIDNLDNSYIREQENSKLIGFYCTEDHLIYLSPDDCIIHVKNFITKTGDDFRYSKIALGDQLKHEKLLVKTNPGLNTYKKRWNETNNSYWVLQAASLDITISERQVFQRSADQPVPNNEGLF